MLPLWGYPPLSPAVCAREARTTDGGVRQPSLLLDLIEKRALLDRGYPSLPFLLDAWGKHMLPARTLHLHCLHLIYTYLLGVVPAL